MDPIFTEEQLNRMSRADMLFTGKDHAGSLSETERDIRETSSRKHQLSVSAPVL